MAAVAIATQPPGIDVSWLPPNTAMSRYGVSYLRTICSQGGLGFTETPTDEDHRAIDGSVDFDDGPVYTQVKATCGYKIRGKSISVPADPKWFRKWGLGPALHGRGHAGHGPHLERAVRLGDQ